MKNKIDHTSPVDNLPESNALAELRKMDVFKTPENYFQTLPAEISSKIHAGNSLESEPLFSFPKFAFAAALVVALLVTGTLYFMNQSGTEKTQVAITYDDLINSGIAYEYDDHMLIDYYFSNKSATPTENNSGMMNDYLIDDNIDITLIINEL